MTVRPCPLRLAPAAAARRVNHEPVSRLHLDEPTGATLNPLVVAVLLFARPEVDAKGAVLTALHAERFADSVLGYDGECEGDAALEGADDSVTAVPFASSPAASPNGELSDEDGETPF